MGIRLATYIVDRLKKRGDDVELIDAKAIGLPMLDRMYKEYPKEEAPPLMEELAGDSGGRTPSCSSPANITGACSPASRT